CSSDLDPATGIVQAFLEAGDGLDPEAVAPGDGDHVPVAALGRYLPHRPGDLPGAERGTENVRRTALPGGRIESCMGDDQRYVTIAHSPYGHDADIRVHRPHHHINAVIANQPTHRAQGLVNRAPVDRHQLHRTTTEVAVVLFDGQADTIGDGFAQCRIGPGPGQQHPDLERLDRYSTPAPKATQQHGQHSHRAKCLLITIHI